MTETRELQPRAIGKEDEDAPNESGLYLAWSGRTRARQTVPTPRILEPVLENSDPSDTDPGNLLVEGDNRQVLVSLMGQYRGRVDVVLIDPPYNTGNRDLRYSDKRNEDPDADDDDAAYVSNVDGRKHTKWLNQMAPTLRLIQAIMAPHGVIFVHISDIELSRLLSLMEDTFGEQNRLGVLIWKSATDNNPTRIAVEHEYIVCYAKDESALPKRWLGPISEARELLLGEYRRLRDEVGDEEVLDSRWKTYIRARKRQLPGGLGLYERADLKAPYRGDNLQNPGREGYHYDVIHPVTGRVCKEPFGGYRMPLSGMEELLADELVVFGKDENVIPQFKRYLDSVDGEPLRSVITDFGGKAVNADIRRLFPEDPGIFKNPKPVGLEEYLLSHVATKDALILDAFAGSGTTAHAVMRVNKKDHGVRRFILIEEGKAGDPYATTLTAERLRRARTQEDLPGGFTFYRVTRQIDAAAFATFQRHETAAAIRQADATGRGTGIRPIDGRWVIGANSRDEAICLDYKTSEGSLTTAEDLRAMFDEVYGLGLRTPLRVYGEACDVVEDDSFTFLQIPGELLRNLSVPGLRKAGR